MSLNYLSQVQHKKLKSILWKGWNIFHSLATMAGNCLHINKISSGTARTLCKGVHNMSPNARDCWGVWVEPWCTWQHRSCASWDWGRVRAVISHNAGRDRLLQGRHAHTGYLDSLPTHCPAHCQTILARLRGEWSKLSVMNGFCNCLMIQWQKICRTSNP